ncbi:peptidoglycan D,D-transpeptidase FtsI family protein [Thermoflavimicrobium dichotomicum]|uniref:Stage V sporulation protein D (Sporulation-specific penicillin-binding protein)/penicillin-binding protein 2B n=1 Tax=Thermoflavimicrobium dichotomicum TaxID=46223 RepID=A0A1I3N7G4_9BACL|nr:penicillin-binding protein 2 [Thermoflavimicrobium dichotomicum]SFJ04806.1 stage V sporulation protein D (sporulation-specific penicillin-binding protein)/penicillin-binding protein 2B [Thermoflavimicrobium dichotomicum]
MGSPLKRSKERSLLVGLILTLCLAAIIFRLLWIQTVESDELLNQAQKNWENSNQIIKAKRGTIYDRTGTNALAWEVPAYYFVADPKQIKDVKKTAKLLSPILQIPEHTLIEKLSQNKPFVQLKVGGQYKYPKEVYDEILKLKDQDQLQGIYGYRTTDRHYNGNQLAHVLGFLNHNDQPVGGVESYYNEKWLKGKDGIIKYKKAKDGMMISDGPEKFQPPEPGKDLVLTIDLSIQKHVEEVLDRFLKSHPAKGATAIVADPRNGEILAMASRPAFDPRSATSTYTQENGHNMAVQSQFEPGSTFKIVTLAAAINEKLFDPNETFESGTIRVDDQVIRDWQPEGWGTISYREGVYKSSNVAFVHLAGKLGAERFMKYIERFGFGKMSDKFGKKTGIDLPAEEKGVFYNRIPYRSEIASAAFGQGISVTPIQQVQAVCAIANGGVIYKPHLLKEVWKTEKEKLIERVNPEGERIIEQETAKKVRELLRGAVKFGTGQEADLPGYRVAGKTGTAQKPDPNGGGYLKDKYIVSFIGFAPADSPDVVVYVAFDEPTNAYGSTSGGTIAAPAARDILKKVLQIRKVPQKKEEGFDLK